MSQHWVNFTWAIGVSVFGCLLVWAIERGDERGDWRRFEQSQLEASAAAQKEDNQQELRLECLQRNRIWQAEICLPGPLHQEAK